MRSSRYAELEQATAVAGFAHHLYHSCNTGSAKGLIPNTRLAFDGGRPIGRRAAIELLIHWLERGVLRAEQTRGWRVFGPGRVEAGTDLRYFTNEHAISLADNGDSITLSYRETFSLQVGVQVTMASRMREPHFEAAVREDAFDYAIL